MKITREGLARRTRAAYWNHLGDADRAAADLGPESLTAWEHVVETVTAALEDERHERARLDPYETVRDHLVASENRITDALHGLASAEVHATAAVAEAVQAVAHALMVPPPRPLSNYNVEALRYGGRR